MMRLTAEEEAMLAGDSGPAVTKAMEILVALGTIYGAEDLVPVSSVQVAGVSFGNVGQAGLEFIQEWADQGARVVVPTTLNPAGMDLEAWQEMGVPEDFARPQLLLIEAYKAMGITISCSCTPYLLGVVPQLGEHLAWSESSAVGYANSVLGARTNREGGPSALAAAITGRTPNYGLHLDHNRQAQLVVNVKCEVDSVADYGALGYVVGKWAGDSVPYLRLLSGRKPGLEQLKAFSAALAASGAVALYHLEDVTAEARLGLVLSTDLPRITIESLEDAYRALDGAGRSVDLVWIGCPHASLEEMEQVADLLSGRTVTAELWVTGAREIVEQAQARGLSERLQAAGARLVAGACLIGAPLRQMGFTSVATNSSKGAFYLRSLQDGDVRFGSLAQCIEAAVTGSWDA
jgi:predicted aconitase